MHITRRVSSIVLASMVMVGSVSLAACGSDSATDTAPTAASAGGAGAGTGGSSASAGHAGNAAAGHAGTSGHAGATAGGGGTSGGHAGVGGGHAGSAGGPAGGGQGGSDGGHAGNGAAGKGAGTGGAAGSSGGSTAGTSGEGTGGSSGEGTGGSSGQGTGGAGEGGAAGPTGAGGDAAGTGGTAAGGTGGSDAGSSFPTDPISYMKEQPFTVDSGTVNYVYVPSSYDDTHMTPTTLLVWLHGCGGVSSGDIWVVSPGGSQSWISLAVGGQEGNCWDVDNDPARVLAALADIKTHFNIKPKGVILGGYSSGGDLTYRTMFYNAGLFAGVIVENSSPYRDTGSKEAASLAAASWKFNAVHLAHLQDTTYPIDGVRKETDSMKAAGFPMTRIETDGGHYDDAGAIENNHPVPGTSADLATFLFPYLDAGWTAP